MNINKIIIVLCIVIFVAGVIVSYCYGYSSGLDDGFKYGREIQTEAIIKYLKSGELQIDGYTLTKNINDEHIQFIDESTIWHEAKGNISTTYRVNVTPERYNFSSLEEYYEWAMNHSNNKNTPEVKVYLTDDVNPCIGGVTISSSQNGTNDFTSDIQSITIFGTGNFIICSDKYKKAWYGVQSGISYNISGMGNIRIGCNTVVGCEITSITIGNEP